MISTTAGIIGGTVVAIGIALPLYVFAGANGFALMPLAVIPFGIGAQAGRMLSPDRLEAIRATRRL